MVKIKNFVQLEIDEKEDLKNLPNKRVFFMTSGTH